MAQYKPGDKVCPQIMGGSVICVVVRPPADVTTEDGQWQLHEDGNPDNKYGGQVFNEQFFAPANPEAMDDEV